MLDALAKNWWVLLIRGVAAIVFGVLAWIWPGVTLKVVILLFGIYAISDGIAAAWFAFAAPGRTLWGLLVVGIMSIIAGVGAILWPGLTAVMMLSVIAAWAIVRGVFEIIAAIQLRAHIENEWAQALEGLISIAFGVMLFAWPGAGLLSLMWLVGCFAIGLGIVEIMLAFRLKGVGAKIREAT
ncbi:MAG: HdeD family acid-resistance protein [Pirellulales bacterium]|nr:HdeD family acid-resistance protein [Pirellulales bacterium]